MFYFTANHIVFIFYISILLDNIKKTYEMGSNAVDWIVHIIAIIASFIGLSIYLELIEINCYELNKFTRRSIRERSFEQRIPKDDLLNFEDSKGEEEENPNKDDENNMIEIVPGYMVNWK